VLDSLAPQLQLDAAGVGALEGLASPGGSILSASTGPAMGAMAAGLALAGLQQQMAALGSMPLHQQAAAGQLPGAPSDVQQLAYQLPISSISLSQHVPTLRTLSGAEVELALAPSPGACVICMRGTAEQLAAVQGMLHNLLLQQQVPA